MASTKSGGLTGGLQITDVNKVTPSVDIEVKALTGDVDAAVKGELSLAAGAAFTNIYHKTSLNHGADTAAHVIRIQSRLASDGSLATSQALLATSSITTMSFSFTDLILVCGNTDADIERVAVKPPAAGGDVEYNWVIAGL
jgi:hypothetical protein